MTTLTWIVIATVGGAAAMLGSGFWIAVAVGRLRSGKEASPGTITGKENVVSRKAAAELAAARATNESLQQQLEQAQKEARNACRKSESVTKEFEVFRDKSKKKEKALETANQQIVNLRGRLDEKTRVERDLENTTNRASTLTQEVVQSREKQRSLEKRLKEARSSIEEKEKQLGKLQSRLQVAEAMITRIESPVVDATDSKEKASIKKIKTSEQKLRGSAREDTRIKNQGDALKVAKNAYANLNERVVAMSAENDKLRAERDELLVNSQQSQRVTAARFTKIEQLVQQSLGAKTSWAEWELIRARQEMAEEMKKLLQCKQEGDAMDSADTV